MQAKNDFASAAARGFFKNNATTEMDWGYLVRNGASGTAVADSRVPAVPQMYEKNSSRMGASNSTVLNETGSYPVGRDPRRTEDSRLGDRLSVSLVSGGVEKPAFFLTRRYPAHDDLYRAMPQNPVGWQVPASINSSPLC